MIVPAARRRLRLLAGILLILVAGASLAGCGGNNDPKPGSTVGGQMASPETINSPASSEDRMVVTYFYHWYDLPDGPHSGPLTDHPADSDASYLDVSSFRQELLDMQEAGIDAALASYWGIFEPSSTVGLRNLVAAYDALVSEGQSPPKVGMFLDTGAIARLEPQYRDLTEPQNQEIFYSLIRGYYDVVPERVWARIDGRPTIWLWAAYFGIQFDRTLFDYIAANFEADYGIRPYIVGEDIWRYAHPSGGGVDYDAGVLPLDDFYIWGAAYTGFQEPTGGIAQIGPGYDERTLPGPDRIGRYRDREDGGFYARSFQDAIDSGSRIIAIETWNEFHEASDIANSEEYGRQYIELTRRFVDQFKGVSGSPPTGTACSTLATFWLVSVGDGDCDGFTTTNENQIGTDPGLRCAANSGTDNEGGPDRWPVDVDDDQFVNTIDVGFYVSRLGSTASGGAPYDIRYDLTFNGIIDTVDLGRFVPFLGKGCTP